MTLLNCLQADRFDFHLLNWNERAAVPVQTEATGRKLGVKSCGNFA